MKNIALVGTGPSNVFLALKLIKKGFDGQIDIFEKGNSLTVRDRKEVCEGFAGAGCFSDSKLSVGLLVGNIIPGLTQEEFDKYVDEMLVIYNEFKKQISDPSEIVLKEDGVFETGVEGMEWLHHKTNHIGTDNGVQIFLKMEELLKSQPNVNIKFNTEVVDVFYAGEGSKMNFEGSEVGLGENLGKYTLHCRISNSKLTSVSGFYDAVIVGTGQRGTLPNKLISKFNLETLDRPFQLGIRVEDTRNETYDTMIAANYDFKVVKNYTFPNGVTGRVRTFCCNSGIPAISVEDNGGMFKSYNGHAFRNGEKTNLVNYGIICELTGYDKFTTKEEQFQLCKDVNNHEGFDKDNIIGVGRPLLEDFCSGDKIKNACIEDIYPEYTKAALKDFISNLNKFCDLSKAHYYYPEAKFDGKTVKYSPYFETSQKNLFIIGDACCTRGIAKSAYTGLKVADYLLG